MSNVCTRMSLICHTYVARMYPYVICMLLVCAPILSVCTLTSSVCHSYVLVCHPYVTRMYSYVIRKSLVCAPMSSVCHSYVLVCHLYVTHMYSHVIRTWLVCGFTVNLYCMQMLSFKRHNTALVQMEILKKFQLLIYFFLSWECAEVICT